MSTLFRATLSAIGPIALSFSLLAACSDSTPTPGPDAANTTCPSTIAQATKSGTTCEVQNEICVVGYPCSPVFQQATCRCDGAAGWSCLLANGTAVDPDTTDTAPLCKVVSGGNPDACPATPADGDGTSCKTSGEICSYVGLKCTGDPVAHIDTCQCNPHAQGDAGLSWSCEVAVCP